MTNRVLLGQRGSAFGMWVSKPGFDVLTAADDKMNIITNRVNLQLVQSGFIDTTGNAFPYSFSIPDLGYLPFIRWMPSGYNAYLSPASNTLMRFYSDGAAPASGVPRCIFYWVFTEYRG
ncbi:hypothetical protein EVB78_058 [Rhizobium phage RHph_N1_15]|nr:hypothetical protein EVB77_057 [Rhizobium phage RHph_N1_10]QIG69260.1 hypothetical protein EVB78_058 [Rhizobium phage RHph_N1_15]QIG75120.1 hypothetical protein EVC15_058 [Rhizobium phage RHph_N2_6]